MLTKESSRNYNRWQSPVGAIRDWSRWALAVYWPALAVATHVPASRIECLGLFEAGLDKLLHAGCFGVLTYLVLRAGLLGSTGAKRLTYGMGLVGAYAIIDELTQGWFDRSADWRDLMADWAGIAAIGLAVYVQPPRWIESIAWDQESPVADH